MVLNVKKDFVIMENAILINQTSQLKSIPEGFNRIYFGCEFCEKLIIQPTFVIDFPKESSPLSKAHRQNPELIERFEPFVKGVEIGNGYSELNDPVEQRCLLEDQAQKLRAGLETATPMDERFVEAIEAGLPPASGVGLGIDRMMMFLTGAQSIRDVIAFPICK